MVLRRLFYLITLLLPLLSLAQSQLDFREGRISVAIDPITQMIKGQVTYSLDVLARTDSIKIDARQMEISEIRINRKTVDYNYDQRQITVYRKLKESKQYELTIAYAAKPQKAVYFIGWEDDIAGNEQVWTQGQGKYSSHWVPSFDDMSEKVVFDLEIQFDSRYELIANGILKKLIESDSLKTWTYEMKDPMSSYLLAFAAGNYERDSIVSRSGIPIYLYAYADTVNRKEPTYRYTSEIMDFLEEEIGVPYPWQNYKQIPVRDFLYAGMENTGTTIFSDSFLIDSTAFVDKNYVDVNAHEMAHQWFGNLVTEVSAEEHWLHEGFATYYSQLAQKEIFGDDHYYWKLFETAELLKEQQGESLTDPKASSLTFYEKGAWALVALREQIGDRVFSRSIQRFLESYRFTNVTIDNFLDIAEEESGASLSEFRTTWLEAVEFPYDDARSYLKKHSPSVKSWYDLRWELTVSQQSNEAIIRRYWPVVESGKFREQVLKKFIKSLSNEYISEILHTGDTETRRAIAVYLERIPPELKLAFESLLEDPSYVTKENALFKLWIYFPDSRAEYLNETRDIYGLPNFNFRVLWLFLATLTNDFDDEEARLRYRTELFGYTSETYAMEIRQNAFALITEVFDLPEQNLKDLVSATVHHSWQFRSYARNLLKEIMKDGDQRARLIKISKELNGKEQRYLNKELEAK